MQSGCRRILVMEDNTPLLLPPRRVPRRWIVSRNEYSPTLNAPAMKGFREYE